MLFAGLAGLLALTIGAAAPAYGGQLQEEARSTIITNARVVDGTGSPARDVDVRIRGDRIVDVGKLEPEDGERVVDADRLVLAPGFIDTHSHFDRYPEGRPDPPVTAGQGITTVVGGHDGISPYPIGDYLETLRRRPPPVNVAMFVGFRTLREQVRGVEGRSANAAQRVVLRALLRRELRTGALGLTASAAMSGDTTYSEELEILAREAADAGRAYVSQPPTIEALLAIAPDSADRLHITHPLRTAVRSGGADSLIQRLDALREDGVGVSIDVHPDTGAARDAAVRLLAWEHANVAGARHPLPDAARDVPSRPDSVQVPPDSASATPAPFARVLERLVRSEEVFTLESAIRRMTLQAALNLGIEERGVIREGTFADLVLFDPAEVAESAVTGAPLGFHTVWVNGVVVLQDGNLTGERPGRALPGGASPDAQREGETSAANSRSTSSYSGPASSHSPLWPAPSTQYFRFGSGAAR